jgi:hypothetical protein
MGEENVILAGHILTATALAVFLLQLELNPRFLEIIKWKLEASSINTIRQKKGLVSLLFLCVAHLRIFQRQMKK